MKNSAFGRVYTNFRGRITPAQKSALKRYSGLYRCKDAMSLGDLVRDGVYKGIGLEIGFGMGVELIRWAEEAPDTLIVGIELINLASDLYLLTWLANVSKTFGLWRRQGN